MADAWDQFPDHPATDPWGQFPDHPAASGLPVYNATDIQGLTNVPPERIRGASPGVGPGMAALEGIGQGLSFGFEDELEATGRAIAAKTQGDQRPFSQLYDEAIKIPRDRQEAAAEQHPYLYYGGDIASSLATPLGLEKLGTKAALTAAQKALPWWRRALEAGKVGGRYGLPMGVGHTEGSAEDTSTEGLVQNALERAEGGLGGYLGGRIAGTAAQPLVDVGANLAGRMATPVRAMLAPRKFANEKFAEALARDVTSSGSARGINDALTRTQARITNAQGSPAAENMMLADFGGENTRNLLRAAANMPNDEAQRLTRRLDFRQSFAPARIERDLAATMGTKENFYQSVDDLAERMQDAGQRVIQPALQFPTPMTKGLQEVLSRPTMQQIGRIVDTNILNEGRNPATAVSTPLTERLHRMKMELDNQIGIARRAQATGNRPQAGWDLRTLTTLKRDLMTNIDNPMYKAGLKMYADAAQLKGLAQDWHDGFFKMAPEEIKRGLADMTEPEKRMARLGATRAIADKINAGNVMRDRTENLFASPEMYKRLQAVFPSNAERRAFQKTLVLEARKADTRRAVQGNSTTAKQLMQAQEAGEPLRAMTAVTNVATGRLEPLLHLISRTANRFSGITPATANSILKTAQQKGLGNMRGALIEAMLKAERSPRRRALLAKTLSVGGVAIGEAPRG